VAPFPLPPSRWPRVELFEWTDLPWLPRPLRRWLGDYLRGILALTRLFEPAAPILAGLLRASGRDRVVDLCSGAGGPWPALASRVEADLGRPVHVVLTDLHPDAATWTFLESAAGADVSGHASPVAADAVPPELAGVRTLFDGLHHLPPGAARAVLAAAADDGVPLLAAEAVERTATGLLVVLLSPLLVWIVTPFLRPVSPARLAFTYLLPVVPLLVLWDGVVSVLRCYRADELRALTAGLGEGYTWDVVRTRPRGPAPTILVGTPARRGDPP
jgi:hypothetical protein